MSIYIAQLLGLEFYIAAGIITILCIKVTKKESVQSSLVRVFASLIGLGIGSLLFPLLGYTPLAVAIILLCFIPILVRLKIQDGFITSSVVLLHLYTNQQVDWAILLNEIQLISVGIGIALLMNLYMPNMEKKIIGYRQSIERNFSLILKEMVDYLRYGKSDWDGNEMLETVNLLHEAKSLAFQDVENHLLRKQNTYYFYFEMREKQFELIGNDASPCIILT